MTAVVFRVVVVLVSALLELVELAELVLVPVYYHVVDASDVCAPLPLDVIVTPESDFHRVARSPPRRLVARRFLPVNAVAANALRQSFELLVRRAPALVVAGSATRATHNVLRSGAGAS